MILEQLLVHSESFDATIACFDAPIEEYCRPFELAIEQLDTIAGVARRSAEVIVAEISSDMTRFASANQ